MKQSIKSLKSDYLQGSSVLDATKTYLEQITDKNPSINAVIYTNTDQALRRAEKLDKQKDRISELELFGVPLIIKDNIDCEGLPQTCGSKLLQNYTSPNSAFVVEKLLKAGAIILGKANMDEFAMGSANLNSAYSAVKNPWNLKKVPGGSSGGSAAAVAANMCLGSLGSDTGGSIRQPASFCGVFGLKPTYGAVSRRGLTAFASSLDHIGPMAQSIDDLEAIYNVIKGYDKKDATSVPVAKQVLNGKSELEIKKSSIIVFEESFDDSVEEEIKNSLSDTLDNLTSQGAQIQKRSFKCLKAAVATYYILATAEASSNLSRFDGVRYGMRAEDANDLGQLYEKTRSQYFGREVKKRILLGTYALSAGYYDAYYQKAMRARSLMQQEMAEFFEGADFILGPTAPSTAFAIDRSPDDLKNYINDIFTIPANIAGVPALSVPLKLSSDKLPIGLQITANHFKEKDLFSFARELEMQGLLIAQEAAFYDQ